MTKGFYRGGWDEPQFVCQIGDLATPEVCAAAGLHRHNTRPRLAEEGQNLVPPQSMCLENNLRQIEPDRESLT